MNGPILGPFFFDCILNIYIILHGNTALLYVYNK